MREQLSLSDIQYGPFLPFLRKKDVTDIDYNGRELWIRDIHNIRHKVTDEKIRQRLNEEFIQSFATNVANLVGKNLTPTDNVIEAETEELRITVIHESVASTGTCICIRKTPPVQRITPKKALEEHYCEEKVLHLLANCVKAKLNMVFCGEPGVGGITQRYESWNIKGNQGRKRAVWLFGCCECLWAELCKAVF